MLKRWQVVGNTVSDLTGPRFNFIPPAPETNALPHDQLADAALYTKYQWIRLSIITVLSRVMKTGLFNLYFEYKKF